MAKKAEAPVTEAPAIAWQYTGSEGQHHSGIPMRDLAAADMAKFTDYQVSIVVKSRLYQPASTAAKKLAADAAKAAAAAQKDGD